MVNGRVVGDGLDPSPLTKAFMPLAVFFDPFEDVGAGEGL